MFGLDGHCSFVKVALTRRKQIAVHTIMQFIDRRLPIGDKPCNFGLNQFVLFRSKIADSYTLIQFL